MPRLIVTAGAQRGLERCRRFLATKASEAAVRAGRAIERQFLLLEQTPLIGRPYAKDPTLHELVIAFGESGYIALYRFDPGQDTVVILAFRHQREAGY